VPNVTTRSLYPECIANLKLPIDTFYRESRSGVNIAKHNITTGLFGLTCILAIYVFDLTNLKDEKRRNVGKLNNELNIVNQLADLHFLLFLNITGN
jgi:hypothetical protein